MDWGILSKWLGGDPFVDKDIQAEEGGPPAPLKIRPPYTTGTAPDPSYYAAQGKRAGDFANNVMSLGEESAETAMPYLLGTMLNFHRGGTLDAQAQGGSRGYGNYNFGIYNAAAGQSLSGTLNLANRYGSLFSYYPPGHFVMDKDYPAIPADNVANITRGFNDYKNNTLWHKPQ